MRLLVSGYGKKGEENIMLCDGNGSKIWSDTPEEVSYVISAGDRMFCVSEISTHSVIYSYVKDGEGYRFVDSVRFDGTNLCHICYSDKNRMVFGACWGSGDLVYASIDEEGRFISSGSYIEKDRKLFGEAVTIVSLDTFVALTAGFIVFPACFTFNGGQTADAGSVGASFLMTTLSSIFNQMPGGRIIGALFFLFMIFAALSTVIAVFENIMSFWLELTKLKRGTVAIINILLLLALSMPCILSFTVLSDVTIFGKGIMDLEDFAVSNILLPLGSLIYVLFCTTRYGWGWDNFISETNTGDKGVGLPRWIKPYMQFVLPIIIIAVFIMSII